MKQRLADLKAKSLHVVTLVLAFIFSLSLFVFQIFHLVIQQIEAATTLTWDGGGTTNNWSDCDNWTTNTCPVAEDSVIFNATSTKDSTIDSGYVGTINAFSINSGYTGTITLARSLIVTGSFAQNAGHFTAANEILDLSSFGLSSGADFTASSNTTTMSTMGIAAGATFIHNSGTIIIDHSTGAIMNCGGVTFNLVQLNNTGTFDIQNNCTLPLGNNPTIGPGSSNGTFSGTGTLSTSGHNIFYSGATLSGFTGIAANSLTINGATANFGSYTSFTTSGNLSVNSGSLTLPVGSDLNGALIITGGIFTAPFSTITLAGNLTISGSPTFNANGGTLSFDGLGPQTLSCNNVTFGSIILTGSGTKTVNSNCSLPIGADPVISVPINLHGTLSGTGALDTSAVLLTLNSTAVLSSFNSLNVWNLSIDGATGDFGSYTTFTATGDVNLASGTLSLPSGADLNGSLTITGGTFTAPSGTMTLASSLTILGSPTFNANGGTITLDGSDATLACNNVTFNLVHISHTGGTKTINSDCNLPIGVNPTIAGFPVVLDGVLSGAGGLGQNSGGALTINGGALSGFSSVSLQDVTTNGTVDFSGYTVTNISGNLHIASGTFTASSQGINLNGNLTIDGTYNANGGALQFQIGNHTLTAVSGTTFFDLSKTTGGSLTFSGSNIIVTGTLSLQGGGPGDLLTLTSTNPGTQWGIDPQGPRIIEYVTVQDSNNLNATAIDTTNSPGVIDNGNNTNWLFDVANPPGTPTTTSPTNDNTPTWTWTAAADGGSGIDHYTFEWCTDSGFIGCGANTATSITNSYTHTITLADGTWYVRAKSTTGSGNVSAYSANGTVVVDTVAPDLPAGQATNSPLSAVNDTSNGIYSWIFAQLARTSNEQWARFQNAGNPPYASHYLKATDFGFTVPGGSTITGIKVDIERRSSFGGSYKDLEVKLVKGGLITGDNKADIALYWPSSDTYKSYGSNSDLWGLSLTPSDVNATDFGVVLQAHDPDDQEDLAFVDHMQITVYYSTGSGAPATTTPTNDTTPTWTWTAYLDVGSGLATTPYIVEWCQDNTFADLACAGNVDVSATNSFTHTTGLIDGTWYFRVKATDAASNESNYSVNGQAVIDASGPIIPGSPTTTTPTTDTTPPWNWTASTDSGVGLATTPYSVQWCQDNTFADVTCNTNVDTTATNSYTNATALAEGTWYFRVKAKDQLNNESSYSTNGQVVIDLTAPAGPTSVSSSDHTLSTWSTDTTIGMTWTAATDGGSGLAGYSYVFDTSATTDPDTTQDIATVTAVNSATLTDGNAHYFHIRPVDNLGNWGTTVSAGPYFIDTTVPINPGTPITTNPTNDITPTWSWTASTDSGSGLATNSYSLQWCQDSGFIGCGSNTATATTNNYTHSTDLAPGTWYIKVKAIDAVANESSYSSNGEVLIDTQAPTGSLVINSGDPSTTSQNVTLTISASDNISNASNIQMMVSESISFTGGVYEAYDTTKTFTLSSGAGNKVVYIKFKDAVGNESAAYSDSISYTIPVVPTTPTPTVKPVAKTGTIITVTPSPTIEATITVTSTQTPDTINPQGFTVKITITDENGNTVEGVKVVLALTKEEVITNVLGEAIFKNVVNGAQKVTLSYNDMTIEQSFTVDGNKTTNYKIQLEPSNILSTSVVILIVLGVSGLAGLLILGLKKRHSAT